MTTSSVDLARARRRRTSLNSTSKEPAEALLTYSCEASSQRRTW